MVISNNKIFNNISKFVNVVMLKIILLNPNTSDNSFFIYVIFLTVNCVPSISVIPLVVADDALSFQNTKR